MLRIPAWIAILATGMLVAFFGAPVLGREFTAHRYDGTPLFGTSRDTEATNTGFNPHEILTDPLRGTQDLFPWLIFWVSGDRMEGPGDITDPLDPRFSPRVTPGYGGQFAPVVYDL